LTPAIQNTTSNQVTKSITFWLLDPYPPSFAEQPESSLPAVAEATVVARPCSVTTPVFFEDRSHHPERRMLTHQRSYPEVCTG
jgi:hypothetical protein